MAKNQNKLKFGAVIIVLALLAVLISILFFLFIKPSIFKNNNIRSQIPTVSTKTSSVDSQTGKADNKYLILVNKDHKIPDSYRPDLINLPIKYYYSSSKDTHFEAGAAVYLQKMIDAAKNDGVVLKIISGYRTYEYQQNNLNKQIQKNLKAGMDSAAAESAAIQLVAPPGNSEHETGLAADIINNDWYAKHSSLTDDFDQTSAYKWLETHAVEYGFVLRYPKDKTAITKYHYEPWHYRFVGLDAAKTIKENHECLEEYLGETK